MKSHKTTKTGIQRTKMNAQYI